MRNIEHCMDYHEDKLKGGDDFQELLELRDAISDAADKIRKGKEKDDR
jgi:hypothetical protein